FGWELGNNAGYTFFSELAASPPDGRLPPATYTLGGIFDTGGSAQFGTGVQRIFHYQLYLMIDQALLIDAPGDPVLRLFARMPGSPQDARNVVGIYADGGLAWFGPLPQRPKDTAGIAVSILRFTQDFQQQTGSLGGETAVELTYQIAIAPWLVVQPDAQFFFEPAISRTNAYALGGDVVAIF